MDLQGLSFNQQSTDIKLKTDGALKLQAGDVVRGVIKAVNPDGLVQLQVRGKNVWAEAQVPLQAGQELYLQADRMENGKLYLKIVDPQAQAELPDLALRGMLTKLGLKADEITTAVARKLIAYNLPLSKENIEAVVKMTSQVPINDGRILEAAAFVLSRGSRLIDDQKINDLVKFFSSPQAVEEISQVMKQIIDEEFADTPDQGVIKMGDNKETNSGAISASSVLPQDKASTSPTEVNKNILPASQKISIEIKADGTNADLISTSVETDEIISKPSSAANLSIPTLEEETTSFQRTPKGTAADSPQVVIDTKPSNSQQPKSFQTNDTVRQTVPELINDSDMKNVSPLDENIPVSLNQKAPTDQISGKIVGQPTNMPMESTTENTSNQPGKLDIANLNNINNQPIDTETGLVKPTVSEAVAPKTDLVSSSANNNMTNNQAVEADDAAIIKTTTGMAQEPVIPQGGENKISALPSAEVPVGEKSINTPLNTSPGVPTTSAETKGQDLSSGAIYTLINSKPDEQLGILTRKLTELIKPALEALITNMDNGKPDGNQIKQIIKEQQALLPDIKYARQAVEQLSGGTNHPLRQALDTLEKEWSGQILYNRLEGSSSRDQSNLYITLPLRWQGRVENAQVNVSWRRDNRSRGIPDALTVNVGLNTVNLGAVIFHLRAQGRQLGVSVYLEQDDYKTRVDSELPVLMSQLTSLGYDITFMGSQVVKPQQLRPEFKDDTGSEYLPPVTALDLKV